MDYCALLNEEGYAVVPTGIDPEQLQAWKDKASEENEHLPHMAHSDTMWSIRTHRNIMAIFERIWGTDELIVSYDGMNIKRSTDEPFVLDFHVDQDTTESTLHGAIQGVLALTPSNAETGGTVIVPQSHKHFDVVASKVDSFKGTNHWQFVATHGDHPVFALSKREVQPSLQVGDMLLFDSRTVHAVRAPTRGGLERMVAYVCMGPRSFATAGTLRKRHTAFEHGISTTHWPHHYVDRGDERGPIRQYNACDSCTRKLIDGDIGRTHL